MASCFNGHISTFGPARNRTPSGLSTGPVCECHLKGVSLDRVVSQPQTTSDLWERWPAMKCSGVVLAAMVKTGRQVLPTRAPAAPQGSCDGWLGLGCQPPAPPGHSPQWGRNPVGVKARWGRRLRPQPQVQEAAWTRCQ